MASVEILDRSTMTGKLYEGLVIDPKETAVVAIDMHRGHLDMSVATMPTKPEDAERVVRKAKAALALARSRGVPVIHVVLVYRKIPGLGSEGMTQPFWRALHDLVTEEDRLTPGRRSTGAPVRWHSSNSVYRYGSSRIRSSSMSRQIDSHGSPNAPGSCRAVPIGFTISWARTLNGRKTLR